MISDGLLMLGAGGLFWVSITNRPRPLTWPQFLIVTLVIAICFILMMHWAGGYRVERYTLFWRATRDLLGSFVPAVVVGMVMLETFVPNVAEQHHWLEAWVAAIFVALFTGRQLAHLLMRVVHREAILMRQVLVVGEDSLTRDSIVTQIQQSEYAHDYNLVGILRLSA